MLMFKSKTESFHLMLGVDWFKIITKKDRHTGGWKTEWENENVVSGWHQSLLLSESMNEWMSEGSKVLTFCRTKEIKRALNVDANASDEKETEGKLQYSQLEHPLTM